MKKTVLLLTICLVLASCSPTSSIIRLVQPASAALATATLPPPATSQPTPQSTATATITTTPQVSGTVKIPNFDHIVLIVLENEYYQDVIENSQMPHLGVLAQQNVLLSNYFAVSHPSLPNFFALVSGSTQNITSDCTDCFLNQPNLADEIEAGGRTWKSYQESMPSPCFIGDARPYVQMRNPFLYFDSIRLNAIRCDRSIVPLTQLDSDLAANQLPNFSLIMPDLCDSGHNCSPVTADNWVNGMVAKLQASPALGQNSLIIITFDEGAQRNTAPCCGAGTKTRGQVPAVLISPMARQGYTDSTIYTHYSLLKTILVAWNLPDLGQTSQDSTRPIVAPWNTQLGQ